MSQERFIPTDAGVAQAEALWADDALQGEIDKAVGASWKRLKNSAPFRLHGEELSQAGWVGAWLGCCGYDATRGTTPIQYISHAITWGMRRYIRGIARERGCSGAQWDAREYEEHEFPLNDPQTNECALAFRDWGAEAALADAIDGDWTVFRARLPEFLRVALDGMLEGLSLQEAADSGRVAYGTAAGYRSIIRRLWTEFEAADRQGRCMSWQRNGQSGWSWVGHS